MTTVVNRREFLKAGTAASTSFLAAATPTYVLGVEQAEPERPRSANDQVQLALIGAGGRMLNGVVQEFVLRRLTSGRVARTR